MIQHGVGVAHWCAHSNWQLSHTRTHGKVCPQPPRIQCWRSRSRTASFARAHVWQATDSTSTYTFVFHGCAWRRAFHMRLAWTRAFTTSTQAQTHTHPHLPAPARHSARATALRRHVTSEVDATCRRPLRKLHAGVTQAHAPAAVDTSAVLSMDSSR